MVLVDRTLEPVFEGVVEALGEPVRDSLPRVLGGRDRWGRGEAGGLYCRTQLSRG